MWRMAQRGQRIVVKLTMGAKTLPDADSFNTVVEIKGWQHPEQVEPIPPSQTPTCLTCLSVYLVISLFQSLSGTENLFVWAVQMISMGNLISLSLCLFPFGGMRKDLFLLTPDIPTAV